MKKVLLTAMSGVLAVSLAACGNGSESGSSKASEAPKATEKPKDPVEIEFWTMQLSPTFDAYLNGVIDSFQKENPTIKVKWVDVPWNDMEKKILANVAAQKAPDVANLNPQFASQLAQMDALINMDEAVPAADKAKYFEGVWKANSFGGKTFGIPWYLSTSVTMYNATLFEKAGLDPKKAPATYDEAMTMAKAIKEKTGKHIFMPTLDGSQLLESMVQMGVQLTNPEGTKAAFNTPEGQKAVQYWVDMYKNDLIPKNSITDNHGKATDLYQAGEVAMLPSGPQFLKIVGENAPDVAKATVSAPQLTGSTGKMNVAVMNLTVPKQTKHKEEAVKFALYLTNAKNQLEFSKLTAILPSVKEAAEDAYFKQAGDQPIDKARAISAAQLAKSEVLVPPMKNFNDLKKAMYEAVQKAMLDKASVADALKEAEQKWNDALSK